MAWKTKPTSKSVQCHGESVRHHRRRLTLTQEELAALAGCSSRLVAKAEAGGRVHPDSVEQLAAAFSLKGRPVFPEDLVFAPKEVVRRIIESYARYERQCAVHCQQFLAEDVTVVAPGDPAILPFAGEHHSIDGFDYFWGQFFRVMERVDKRIIVDSMRMLAEENQVVVLTHELATHVAETAPPPITPIGFVFEFERGKLKRLEDHFDVRYVQQKVVELLGRKQAPGPGGG